MNAISANAQQSEDLIRSYMSGGSKGAGGSSSLVSPDFVLQVAGEGRWPIGGEYSGTRLSELMKTVGGRFPQGISLTIDHIFAKEDRVVVEASGNGTRCDGYVYHNNYVFIFVIRDGQILRQIEFNDLLMAQEALCGPLND